MGISLNPTHVKRYAQIASLLMKYGRSDLVKQSGLDEALEAADERHEGTEPKAEELANDLEALGPTYTKLGQLLSSRVDLLPKAYTEALARLQENVQPFPFEQVREIVEEELRVKISQAFLDFEPEPIAAASLGQVHRARLRSGRVVAVKVQRPGVREQIIGDFEALAELAIFAEAHTELGKRYRAAAVLEEMRRTVMNELDYRREAANLATLATNLAEFDRIVVPRAVDDYTTTRVLTMEYIRGRNVLSLSPLARMELDGEALADQLFQAYLKQVLVDGFFHADPHPGNVFLTDDHRIALIDVGMVGQLPPELQSGMLEMLLAMTEGRGRDAADVAIQLGERTDEFDRDGFREVIGRLVLEYFASGRQDLQIGLLVLELTRAAGNHGLIIPPQLAMLGKTLLNLDQVGLTLDPDFKPAVAIQRNAAEVLRRRMIQDVSPSNILASVLETNQFVQRLPGRLNRVFDAIEEREFEVKIRLANDSLLLDGLQKIANRIATGAVLAALIISASMMMQVESSWRLLGYPGLAVLLFAAAVVGIALLLVDIARHDAWARRSARRERG